MLKGLHIKIFTVCSLLLLIVNALIRVIDVEGYSSTIVCLYIGGFALIGFLATVSPYILEVHLSKAFPYLSNHLGRAAFFLFISTLCFGEELGTLGTINGITMIICAGLTSFLHFFAPVAPPSFNAEVYNQEI